MLKQYKLIIAYDGTDFSGWVHQPGEKSVLQTLEDSFQRVFGKKPFLLGASRTDAGVHAVGQAALCKTDLAITPQKLKWAWNNGLPSSISIRSIELDPDFYPHANVLEKTYHYHIFLNRPHPFYARYGTQSFGKVDWELFEKALALFEGTHNFNAFYTGDDREDTTRTIKHIRLHFLKRYNCYRVEIVGEKFLRHMIRRMVGAALAVAQRDSISLRNIKEALVSGQRNCELPTAPAQGLMLYKIRYGNKNAHQ